MQQSASFTVRSTGGVLRVLQTECHVSAAFDVNSAPPHPTFHAYTAIWDTGATNSVITQRVIDELILQPVGITQVQGVHSVQTSDVFLVNIMLMNQVNFAGFPVTRGIIGHGSDVLIGMDIISMGDLAITNKGGATAFSFCAPSLRDIDFVAEQNRQNPRPGFRGFNRPQAPHGGKKPRGRPR